MVGIRSGTKLAPDETAVSTGTISRWMKVPGSMALVGRNLLTVAEAAERIGVQPDAIRNAIRRGALKAERYGSRVYLITPKDLDAYASRPTRQYRDPRRRKPSTDQDETA